MKVRRVGAYILFVDSELGRVDHEIDGGAGALGQIARRARRDLRDRVDQDGAHIG